MMLLWIQKDLVSDPDWYPSRSDRTGSENAVPETLTRDTHLYWLPSMNGLEIFSNISQ
jgi:hypothetical protein